MQIVSDDVKSVQFHWTRLDLAEIAGENTNIIRRVKQGKIRVRNLLESLALCLHPDNPI